ncbi:MAG: PEP-CTERM sorting domain-containing protein [Planctomycetia bacterium]|nr:PEP-CTERM sorting domain-containing protein [Planctomycetia bacterium]
MKQGFYWGAIIAFCLAVFYGRSVHAQTVFSFYDASAQATYNSESADIYSYLKGQSLSLGDGDIFTLYGDIETTGQLNADAVGSGGTLTIQSDTAGTQRKITSTAKRFCDYAHGTYNFTDLHFYGIGNDNGAVLYRNDNTSTTVNMSNVLIEACVGAQAPALRGAMGLTVTGTYTIKDCVSTSDGGAFYCHGGKITLSGDGSVGTFSGTRTSTTGTTVGYDLMAGMGVDILDAGEYTLSGGISTSTLIIDKATVTLQAGSKTSITTGATLKNGATLNLGTSMNKITTAADGTLNLIENGVVAEVTSHAGAIVLSENATVRNLSSASGVTTGTITTAPNVTNPLTLTLNNTSNTTYYGSINIGTNTLYKTGTGSLTLNRAATVGDTYVQEGTLVLGTVANTPVYLSGDVYLDGGTLSNCPGDSSNVNHTTLADGSKLYVTAKGGTYNSRPGRAFIINGIHSPDGVTSGNLVLTGTRGFITGTSTFNGYFEIQSGKFHFSNEAVASSKGIILNGGTLQFLGDIYPESTGTTRDLSCNIYIKGSAGLQCGWSNNFYLTGTIQDWEVASGKELQIQQDSGFVWLNGTVNTTAFLQVNEGVKTAGKTNITLGGLNGTNAAKVFENATTTATDNLLTLNVVEGASYSYGGQLLGKFNLLKSGAGTQTFATTGVGSADKPLNSVRVSGGALALSGNAPVYASTMSVGENATLQLATGSYSLDLDTLDVSGDVVLSFASDTDYSKLNLSSDATLNFDSDGFISLLALGDYAMSSDTTYQVSDLFPDFGDDFDYDALLSSNLRYTWNLVRSGDGLLLSMDPNAVPEPATWALMFFGALGLGICAKKRVFACGK